MKLVGLNEIDWNPSVAVPGFTPKSVYFGQGNPAQAMQIATGAASSSPSRTQLKSLYSDRKGKLPISLMLAIEFDDQVIIFGPDPDSETLFLRPGNAGNFLNAVLAEPEESLSYQRAISIRRALQTTNISGFTNNGLFASHYIRTSAPAHPSWEKCLEDSKKLVDLRNKNLIEGLGFEITANPANTHVLRAKGQDKRVVAVLLDQNESFDGKSARFQASPVEWGLSMATNEGAPWLIAIRDSQIRLYPAKDGVGVGQKSQVETYFEIDLLTIDEEKAALLPLIFSADALSENGTADELLRESQKFAAALGTRLRERVYESIVPQLATEIANQLRDKGHNLDSAGLQLAYGLTLRVLFRLLFQAYAEDRGLLPAGRNERFDKNSLKDRAADLIKHGPDFDFGDSSSIWFDHMQIWNAIDQGSPEMQIPAYNGGLFGTDQKLHPEGFLIRSLNVPDKVMGPALRALVIDDNTEDGVPGMVDFRSLSVREFGTIYEGLLESSLSVAEQDLTVDKKGAWVPAQKSEPVLAKKGQVYFHSASGERKATGSYYTPSFVVDHLIERSVEPALKNHLAKVKEKIVAGDQAAAYDLFFDFRVADLAMGSGHFLVAAIDKIETVMRSFLLEPGNEIEGVEAELKRLEDAAKSALGPDEAAYAEIERASLLRRQIARRCIYGLDINPLAVELSRLAIWIHTFVPGLPMSSLEHGLVCANSLTGISSVEEGLNALTPDREARNRFSFCDWIIEDSLSEAKEILTSVANTDEATKRQASEAAEAHAKMRMAAQRSKVIFDLAIANRSGVVSAGAALTEEDLVSLHRSHEVESFISTIKPAHMPYLFPEVFIREDPGFDVVVGNPPWEKIEADKANFMLRHSPGFRSLPQAERDLRTEEFLGDDMTLRIEFDEAKSIADTMRDTLLAGNYPGLGIDHPDLSKAFAWLFSRLSKQGFAIVLPRSLFSGRAMEQWRRELFEREFGTEVAFCVNSGGWAFEGVEGRKEFCFAVSSPALSNGTSVAGPLTSRQEFDQYQREGGVALSSNLLGDKHEFPSAPSSKAWPLMIKMRSQPNFSDSKLFAKSIYETDATKDKGNFDLNFGEGLPVYKGASFELWNPSTGVLYGTIPEDKARSLLWDKVSASLRRSDSSFDSDRWSQQLLPMDAERISYRWTARSTDTRTLIVSLVPPKVVLTNGCPYLVPQKDTEEMLATLAILSSRIFDWYIRRYVDNTLRQGILNQAPFPDLGDESIKTLSNLAQTRLSAKDLNTKVITEAKIDALVATLFELNPQEASILFETFQKGWKYQESLKTFLSEMQELI